MNTNPNTIQTKIMRQVLCASLLALTTTATLAANWKITILQELNAADLERTRLERAYLGHPGGPAQDGWSQGLDDTQFELDSTKTKITWASQSMASLAAAKTAAQQAEKAGHQALVVDLPASWVAAVASAVKIPVVNVGASADSLRESQCQRQLLHTLPSERMRTDALAQALVARKWSQILLLTGSGPDDAIRTATALASIQRYGLKVVAQRPFKQSADPRERDLANPKLLSSGVNYDAVWVVDTLGEFARALPYNIQAARPVVGDAGMVALGWHAQYERYGAPQVSRRFVKSFNRPMTQQDWASWMAGKAIGLAASGSVKSDSAALLQALNRLSLDGSKGVPMQFRPWDGQLQQTMLLTDGQSVIGLAPVEGVLHPRNTLDTLGADSGEKRCTNRL